MCKLRANWCLLVIVLLFFCNLSVVELKRSFGLGRSRPKVSNPNVRRRTQLSQDPPRPAAPAASAPVGPPPAYSAKSSPVNNMAKPNAAPPPYSAVNGAPPSYSAANYPRQTYNAPSQAGAPGMGQTPYYGAGGAHMPGNGLYNNHNSMGYGHSGPGYGGYGGGGFSPMAAGGAMGGYGGGFGGYGGYGPAPYQKSSSAFSFGNILTGLAVWQLARGIGGGFGGGSHHRTEHVYVHHVNQPGQTTVNAPASAVNVPDVVPIGVTALQNATIESIVTMAPCTENCEKNTEANVPDATPGPEVEFVTMHPSLFPYAGWSDSLQYWATSHTKTLNMTTVAPSLETSTTITTTTTADISTTSSPESN